MQLFCSGNCRLRSNIETKSLYTFFPHLEKTPSDNKKINPFINALDNFENQKNIKNLSGNLAVSTFYNQSHFIKDFK